MVVGTNLANFMAYLYHLIIGRILGPSPYGELAASIAVLGLFATGFSFLGTVIVKFVSASRSRDLGALYNFFFRKGLFFALFLFTIFLLIAPPLSEFLRIESRTVILFPFIIFLMFFSFMLRSFLQGLLRFGRSVIVTNVDLMARLVFGLVFILMGLSSFGGVLGILVASFLGVCLGFFFLRDISPKTKSIKYKDAGKVFRYSLPVFAISLAGNSFMSVDVIMAKHYLPSTEAGIYAALSTLGKIIFYGTSPIGAVAFPLISKRFSQKKSYLHFLSLSASLTAFLGLSILLIYLLFPKLMVRVLFGSKFLQGAGYLSYFGLYAFLFAFANLFSSFYLSVEKTVIWIIVFFFAIFQIVGLFFFHDSLEQIIKVSLFSVALLLASLILYFGYERKRG